jgi:hypothetical protein
MSNKRDKTSRRPSGDALLFWTLLLVCTLLGLLTVWTGGDSKNDPHDACGGSGSHPVTIGGVIVIACK